MEEEIDGHLLKMLEAVTHIKLPVFPIQIGSVDGHRPFEVLMVVCG